MEALLQVKNLSIGIHRENKLYSSVEEISFDIYPREILGIVGESGSGKSLTALSIPGLLGENKEVTGGSILYTGGEPQPAASAAGSGGEPRPSDYLRSNAAAGSGGEPQPAASVAGSGGEPRPSGSAAGSGRDLLTLSEKELEAIRGKEISMIFQEPFSSLNPLLKAGEQIAETLELHDGKDKRMRKDQINGMVKELLSKLRFPDPEKIMEAYPHRLSGGMCQRVMIALAVICRPRLLIADEATTALDQGTQEQILSLLTEINRDFGTSILFISHDLSLIKKLCSRVLVMYSGRILEEGGTGEIFSHPAHEYTRGLLGSIPGRAMRGNDLASIPGKIPSLEEGRPDGCPFHPRCGKVTEACRNGFPAERIAGVNHRTRCILYGEN